MDGASGGREHRLGGGALQDAFMGGDHAIVTELGKEQLAHSSGPPALDRAISGTTGGDGEHREESRPQDQFLSAPFVAMPGAPSSVLAPSSKARSPKRFQTTKPFQFAQTLLRMGLTIVPIMSLQMSGCSSCSFLVPSPAHAD